MTSFDTSSGSAGSRTPASAPHWLARLLALVLLVLCVLIGLAGLILPLIPGLVFLAFAGLIAARLFPPLGRRLRRNATFAPYMASSDHFAALNLQGKVKFAFWFAVKVLWDSCVLLIHYSSRLLAWLLRSDSGRRRA
jgi:uncharacterized membrane protein YbaN (DUF454 family)